MGIASSIRAALADRAPVRVSPRAAMPAQLVGARSPFTLSAEDFTAGRQVPGVKSILASYRVPKDTALVVSRVVPFRLYIPATHTETITPTGATSASVTLEHGVVQTVRGEQADVQVSISEDAGVTWTETTVTGVNYGANSVQYTKTAATDALKVTYITGAGAVELQAQKPGGATNVNTRMWNKSLRGLHLTDQDQGESALIFAGRGSTIELAPEWRLNIVVNSPASFDWNVAGVEFFAEAYTQRLEVIDADALNALTESTLR